MIEICILIILILIILIYFYRTETFISFMQNELSEYYQTPFLILVKHDEFKKNKDGIRYPEIDQYNKNLTVMEIFYDKKYKLYSDDGLVREGYMNDNYWQIVWYIRNILWNLINREDLINSDYFIINGVKINMNMLKYNDSDSYRMIRPLYDLMEFSETMRPVDEPKIIIYKR